MKWLRWFVVCAVAAGAPANLAAEVKVEKTQIADGVYLFSCGPDGYVPSGNSIVIVNESDVPVYDSFTLPSAVRQVVEEIRKMTSKPVRYVVNSHLLRLRKNGSEGQCPNSTVESQAERQKRRRAAALHGLSGNEGIGGVAGWGGHRLGGPRSR